MDKAILILFGICLGIFIWEVLTAVDDVSVVDCPARDHEEE
jgi:hypothetical protein